MRICGGSSDVCSSDLPVTLNFVNAEIEGVSRAMGAILKQQFVVDPRVKGTITLYSEEPLSPREAYINFLAALRGLGFTVRSEGRRVGKECVSTCRFRCSPYLKKKQSSEHIA